MQAPAATEDDEAGPFRCPWSNCSQFFSKNIIMENSLRNGPFAGNLGGDTGSSAVDGGKLHGIRRLAYLAAGSRGVQSKSVTSNLRLL